MKKNTLLIAFLAIISMGLHAQNTIKEVVISGSKFESEKKEISQTIDVISGKELKFNSFGNTGDVLQNTGTITVQQSQNGGGSPIIRGFEANRLGIVVDGVRMNTAIFRSGHLQNVLRVDNGQLDRAEVFFGAGSTLYGSDALGGVMNFQTIKPQLNTGFKGNAFARYATATEEKTGGFTLQYGASKFASVTSFTYTDFGNLMMGNIRDPQYGNWGKRLYYQARVDGKDVMIANPNPNEQLGSGYNQYNILQKFLFQPSEKTSHLINFQYSNSSDINRYDRLTETADKTSRDENPISNQFRNAAWFYGPEVRLMAAYTLNHSLNNGFADKIRLTAAYQNYKESRNTRRFGSNNQTSQRENVDIASINLDFSKKLRNHSISYGLEGVINWVASNAVQWNIATGKVTNATTRYPDGGSQTGSYSLYAQDIWEVSKDLAYINLGARYSYNTISATVTDTTRKYGSFEISNSAYSFNAGLSLLPSKNNKLTLNISSGYRTPNLDDVSKIFDEQLFIQVNNPDVKPEMAINFEVNSWNKIAEDLTIEAGAYYTTMTDYIANQITSVNGSSTTIIDGNTYTYQTLGNASTAKIMGAYGSMKLKMGKYFDLFGNVNYTYGRVRMTPTSNEIPLDHIPPMSGRFGLQYHISKFNSELSVLFNGAKNAVDYSKSGEDNIDKSADPSNGFTPAWYIMNLRTSYDFSSKLTAQVALDNIFDTYYRVFASGIASPGRNLRLTLRTSF
jgi:hemoglobin/transferrin/lactoferrin receptor protein